MGKYIPQSTFHFAIQSRRNRGEKTEKLSIQKICLWLYGDIFSKWSISVKVKVAEKSPFTPKYSSDL